MKPDIFQESKINIVSKSWLDPRGGPGKVLINALKGLDNIGQEYVINQNIEHFRYNWIHDDQEVFIDAVVKNIPCVVGPNLFVMPSDLPWFLGSMDHLIYLHPAKWTVDAWANLGFSRCQLKSWPVGIDWEEFQVNRGQNLNEVMLYFKKRPEHVMERVLNELKQFSFKINLVEYGKYDEKEFKNILASSSFGIWVGTTESQGIALQESLASGMPLVVLNNKSVLDNTSVNQRFVSKDLAKVVATSIPHFDDRCGIIIDNPDELAGAVRLLMKRFNEFRPSEFIKETLSLEKQALELVELIKAIPCRSHIISTSVRIKSGGIQFLDKIRKDFFRLRKFIFRKTGL